MYLLRSFLIFSVLNWWINSLFFYFNIRVLFLKFLFIYFWGNYIINFILTKFTFNNIQMVNFYYLNFLFIFRYYIYNRLSLFSYFLNSMNFFYLFFIRYYHFCIFFSIVKEIKVRTITFLIYKSILYNWMFLILILINFFIE